VMKGLEHPHIVRYLGTESLKSASNANALRRVYVFLEYVPGGSLAKMLRQFGAHEGNNPLRVVKPAPTPKQWRNAHINNTKSNPANSPASSHATKGGIVLRGLCNNNNTNSNPANSPANSPASSYATKCRCSFTTIQIFRNI